MRSSDFISAEARARYLGLIDSFIKNGHPALAQECAELAVGQGFWADPLQRPLEFLPNGSRKPVYDASDFWFTRHLEASYEKIRAEIDAVTEPERSGFLPVEEPLLESGRWDQVVLYENGQRQERACALFPVLADVIDQIPEATGMGPGVVTLSWLHPGAHIVAHCGRTNAQLRVHLGITVPDGVTIRVGNENPTWAEGRCIVFDDSFEHEVWHRGTRPRLVLLMDVLYPGLDQRQRERLLAARRSVADRIGKYLTEHGVRRIETDSHGPVLRPVAGAEALIRRYMAETGAAAVEMGEDGLRFEH